MTGWKMEAGQLKLILKLKFMETSEVIKKHEKRFNKSRLFIQILLILITGMIIFLQHENIIRLINWLFNSN